MPAAYEACEKSGELRRSHHTVELVVFLAWGFYKLKCYVLPWRCPMTRLEAQRKCTVCAAWRVSQFFFFFFGLPKKTKSQNYWAPGKYQVSPSIRMVQVHKPCWTFHHVLDFPFKGQDTRKFLHSTINQSVCILLIGNAFDIPLRGHEACTISYCVFTAPGKHYRGYSHCTCAELICT